MFPNWEAGYQISLTLVILIALELGNTWDTFLFLYKQFGILYVRNKRQIH